jgi:hypothetical protein
MRLHIKKHQSAKNANDANQDRLIWKIIKQPQSMPHDFIMASFAFFADKVLSVNNQTRYSGMLD